MAGKSSKRHLCHHCDEYLSYKAYSSHKRRYYDETTVSWLRDNSENELQPTEDEDSMEIDKEYDKLQCTTVAHVPSPSPPPLVELDHESANIDAPNIEFDDSMGPESFDQYDSSNDHDSSDDNHHDSDTDTDLDTPEVWFDGTLINDTQDEVDSDPLCFDEDFDSDELFETVAENSDVAYDGTTRIEILITWIVAFLAALQRKHLIPDVALEALLRFLSTFLKVLGTFSVEVANIAKKFPSSFHRMLNFAGIDKNDFTNFIVCPNPECCSLYQYADCLTGGGTHTESKCCRNVIGKKKCNTVLLKKIHMPNGEVVFRPFKTYCYRSLRKSLTDLLNRAKIIEECEKQRKVYTSTEPSGEWMSDIYHGKVWREFMCYNGVPFLSERNNYAVMINVDWFQPFKRLSYSLGAIYLSLLNLPRRLRFKPENVIIVGLIPGPTEPKYTINSFLRPLVDELLEFWSGVSLNIQNQSIVIRCALICVACDLPAIRKVCGFLSYSANLGCNRCYKVFPGCVGNKNYSGFNRNTWKTRTVKEHRKNVERILKATSVTEKKELVTQFGCRYSELLRLPYFDPIRMSIIDPMHCLYLGITKHVLKYWIEHDILQKEVFQVVEKNIENLVFPNTVGRIPKKIFNSYASFTADQFKNWSNIFSLASLRNVLVNDHWECWKHFVIASRILCQQRLSKNDINLADALLLQFCRRVEKLYKESTITPNMHMACHLKECIEDFGPLQGFWLFPFERYNGLIEKMPCNKRVIEVQFMRRFLRDMKFLSLGLPTEFSSEFLPHFETLRPLTKGSLLDYEVSHSDVQSLELESDLKHIALPNQYVLSSFESDMLAEVLCLYKSSYEFIAAAEDFTLPSCFRLYRSLSYKKRKYVSSGRSKNPVLYFAHDKANQHRPVLIEYFAVHNFSYDDNYYTNCMAYVKWLKCHPEKYKWGKPLEVWFKSEFDLDEDHGYFIHVHQLSSPCVYQIINFDDCSAYLCTSIHL